MSAHWRTSSRLLFHITASQQVLVSVQSLPATASAYRSHPPSSLEEIADKWGSSSESRRHTWLTDKTEKTGRRNGGGRSSRQATASNLMARRYTRVVGGGVCRPATNSREPDSRPSTPRVVNRAVASFSGAQQGNGSGFIKAGGNAFAA